MPDVASMPPPPPRALALSYGAGLLSMGLMDLLVFIVPLWAIWLGANATEVGMVVGARSVLPAILAIHGGVAMDRLGTRRIMAASAIAIILTAPLYPALPWVPALIVLQLVTGYATTIAWVGAQTVIAQVCRGDTGILGRFNFTSRMGTFAAPIFMGLLWDFTTPWLTFLFISVWAAALLGLVIVAPDSDRLGGPTAAETGVAAGAPAAQTLGAKLRAMAPRPSDYTATLALLLIPAIALTIGSGFLRNTTSAVQGSIYIVYLADVGLTGTAIGALIAVLEGASGIGALLAGRATRIISPYTLMVATTGAAIFLINATPLLGGIFVLLLAAQFLRGIIQGIHNPVLFGIQARAVEPQRQGATVALRVTGNRLASIAAPPIVGIIADTAGIEMSFYIFGGVLLVMTAALGLVTRLAPDDGS